jgi:hypothetical protein
VLPSFTHFPRSLNGTGKKGVVHVQTERKALVRHFRSLGVDTIDRSTRGPCVDIGTRVDLPPYIPPA